MTAISASNSKSAPRPGGVSLFGASASGLGLFASIIISVSLGFITFFLTTFLSIFGLMIYNGATGRHVTLAMSYKLIALPAGILVLAGSFVALLALWLRRKLSR